MAGSDGERKNLTKREKRSVTTIETHEVWIIRAIPGDLIKGVSSEEAALAMVPEALHVPTLQEGENHEEVI